MNILCVWFMVCFLLLPYPAMSQTLTDLENQYTALQSENEQNQKRIDSLKNILNHHRLILEQEKRQDSPDQDKIQQILSTSIGISNQIKDNVRRYDHNSSPRLDLKNRLEKIYSHRIDSLTHLSNYRHTLSLDSIQQQILYYTEKRLTYSPVTIHIPIDLKKIKQLDLSSSDDSIDTRIAEQYLQYAQNRIDSNLIILNQIRTDIKSYNLLQQKTGEFLYDIEFYQPFALSSQNPTNQSDISIDIKNSPLGNIEIQYQSLYTLIQQLNYQDPLPSDKLWNMIQSHSFNHLSPESYLKLLDETIRLLEYYHHMIQQKQLKP